MFDSPRVSCFRSTPLTQVEVETIRISTPNGMTTNRNPPTSGIKPYRTSSGLHPRQGQTGQQCFRDPACIRHQSLSFSRTLAGKPNRAAAAVKKSNAQHAIEKTPHFQKKTGDEEQQARRIHAAGSVLRTKIFFSETQKKRTQRRSLSADLSTSSATHPSHQRPSFSSAAAMRSGGNQQIT